MGHLAKKALADSCHLQEKDASFGYIFDKNTSSFPGKSERQFSASKFLCVRKWT